MSSLADFLEQHQNTASSPVQGKLSRPQETLAPERRSKLWLSEHIGHGLGDRDDILWVEQDGRLPDHLGNSRSIGRDDRRAAGHGF